MIPKIKYASKVSDFRPISLCSTFYKIIAKILANRLKRIIPSIVHPAQAAYIAGRDIAENLTLAQDICGDFSHPGYRNKFCAKLDLRKAFDTVNREALLQRLLQKGCPPIFVNWIRACISNVPFSVILNGEIKGFFGSKNGLRQGCPLSPYLFSIITDIFSCLLEHDVMIGNFNPIKLQDMAISHLLYADDVLILGEADSSTACSLNSNLKLFADLTGLQVNSEKSCISFSRHSTFSLPFCRLVNIPMGELPFTYLGLPLVGGVMRISHFNPLIERLNSWLSGWKSKFLSYGGRFQLIRSSINGLLSYWFRALPIPKAILRKINSISSKFFFNLNEHSLHLISWSCTTLPITKGGSGLTSASTLNCLCKTKALWRLLGNSTILAKWLQLKYGSIWHRSTRRVSAFWREVKICASRFKHLISFKVGSGTSFSLYFDNWIAGNSLYNMYGENCFNLFQFPPNSRLCSIISNGAWILPASFELVDPVGALALKNILIHQGDDCLCWNNGAVFNFKQVKLAYFSHISDVDWYKSIWFRGGAINLAIFSWMALIGGLKTSDKFALRGCGLNITCLFCGLEPESHSHLFFLCPFVMNVIRRSTPLGNYFLLPTTFKQLLVEASNINHEALRRLFFLSIAAVVYIIWKERNRRFFGEPLSPFGLLIGKIRSLVAAKLKRWKFKLNWPPHVTLQLDDWRRAL